ncbi:MAG TPA: hypothetical protein VGH25_16805, partial [Dongiaceae bacterium]
MTEAQPASESPVSSAPPPGPAPSAATTPPATSLPHRAGPWLLRLAILVVAAGLVVLLATRWDVWVGQRSRQ